MKNTLIVNLYGGPGSGKSAACGGIFYQLKKQGINCEMTREYAKEIVWEGNLGKLRNQIYIFGKEHRKLTILEGKVDVVISDSPLLLVSIYAEKESQTFKQLIYEEYDKFNNLNFFLQRPKEFDSSGRVHDLKQSIQKDTEILSLLSKKNIPFETILVSDNHVEIIANKIIDQL
jgi:hypothetical protein